MSTTDHLYRGETKPRNMQVAALITLICPGLGYMYIGHMVRGLTINLLFILMLESFIIIHTTLKFFPILPLLVLCLAWLVFSILAMLDVRHFMHKEGSEHYVLKPYNHWLFYSLVALFSFVLPLFTSWTLVFHQLWMVQAVDHSGMFPTILPGDSLLVDRRGFLEAPQRGDIVTVSNKPGSLPRHALRVVAIPGDTVRYEGQMLYVNNEAIGHHIFKNTQQLPPTPEGMITLIEENQDTRYLIALTPKAKMISNVQKMLLDKDRYFLLTDNRSQEPTAGEPQKRMRDSREFADVGTSKVRGKPMFILWSSDPDSGRVRWDRIGLRIQ